MKNRKRSLREALAINEARSKLKPKDLKRLGDKVMDAIVSKYSTELNDVLDVLDAYLGTIIPFDELGPGETPPFAVLVKHADPAKVAMAKKAAKRYGYESLPALLDDLQAGFDAAEPDEW